MMHMCCAWEALNEGIAFLLQVDGQSHVVHSEEEALGTRLTIDSLTCLMANETDPSKLLAISPGKLMRYLVPDESHVQLDQPYAEIEVRCWSTWRAYLQATCRLGMLILARALQSILMGLASSP